MKLVKQITRHTLAGGMLAFVSACGGQDAEEEGDQDQVMPAVIISSPVNNETLEGTVALRLETRDVMIRPAGTDEPGTGHHHLFIDRDISPVGEPIPTGEGIVHLGMGQTELLLEDLDAGDHTIIAVVGDYQHVRLANVATDTVRVTISGT